MKGFVLFFFLNIRAGPCSQRWNVSWEMVSLGRSYSISIQIFIFYYFHQSKWKWKHTSQLKPVFRLNTPLDQYLTEHSTCLSSFEVSFKSVIPLTCVSVCRVKALDICSKHVPLLHQKIVPYKVLISFSVPSITLDWK